MNRSAHRAEGLFPRLPSLLAYPAARTLLLAYAALALLRLLSNLPSLLGLLFEVVFWVMGFKLAVEALTNTAHGRYEPLGSDDLLATDGDAIEQLMLQLAVFLPIVAVANWVGALPALWMLGAAVLFMPAAIMLLTINHSLANALNPLAWFTLIGRLGGAYAAVVVVFAGLAVVSAVLEALFARVLPYGMGLLPASIVSLYFLVASYHILGDLLHRHHAELGLDIEPAVKRATFASPVEDEAMARAEALAAAGKFAAAAATLQDLFRGRGASDAVHDRYRQLLIAAGDDARLAEHGREYASSLLTTGKDRRALAVVAETMSRQPDFRLHLPEHVARLVALAERGGQGQLAVALAQGFESRFPDSPQLPEVVMAAARLQVERLGQDDEARRRLQALLRSHPGHPLEARARELLGTLDRVAARS